MRLAPVAPRPVRPMSHGAARRPAIATANRQRPAAARKVASAPVAASAAWGLGSSWNLPSTPAPSSTGFLSTLKNLLSSFLDWFGFGPSETPAAPTTPVVTPAPVYTPAPIYTPAPVVTPAPTENAHDAAMSIAQDFASNYHYVYALKTWQQGVSDIPTTESTHGGNCSDMAALAVEEFQQDGVQAVGRMGYLNGGPHMWVNYLDPSDNQWHFFDPTEAVVNGAAAALDPSGTPNTYSGETSDMYTLQS